MLADGAQVTSAGEVDIESGGTLQIDEGAVMNSTGILYLKNGGTEAAIFI